MLSLLRRTNGTYGSQHCDRTRTRGSAGRKRSHVFTCGVEQLEARRLLSWTQQGDPLSPADAGPQQRFGESVSIDGDTVLVGRPGDQNAVVFVRCTSPPPTGEQWCEQAILVPEPTPPEQHPQFGWSVAVSGDTAIVGAMGADGAYIFYRNAADDTWPQQAELHEIVDTVDPELLSAGDNFGWSVAIDGGTAVVGALAGEAAYVFERVGTTWTLQTKLEALVRTGQDHFGRSVGVNNNTIIVGAGFADGSIPHGGAAYIFQKADGAWGTSCDTSGSIPVCSENAKLIPDGGTEEQFGWSAAIQDSSGDGEADTAVVSSHHANAAYVFEKQAGGEWGTTCTVPSTSRCQNATLTSGVGEVTGGVAIDGDTIAVGVPQDDGATKDSGAAYVFEPCGTSWCEVDKLTASNGRRGDRFGRSVSVSDGTILVGAIYANGSVNNSGAAYVFAKQPPPLPGPPIIDSLSASPNPVVVGNNVTLTAVGVSDPDDNVVSVAFYRDVDLSATISVGDELFFTDVDGSNGWSAVDNTSGFSLGTHAYLAQAADEVGNESNVASTTLEMIDTPVGVDMHVGDLDGSGTAVVKGKWDASVTITVHDATDTPIADATVSGTWSGGATGSSSCTTDGSGECEVNKNKLKSNVPSVTFSVSDITLASNTYDAAANHDPDGDSDGTSIVVSQAPALRVAADAASETLAGVVLTDPMLGAAVEDAVTLWSARGVDADRLSELSETDVRFGDLSDTVLALAYSDSIVIDRDAAGYGWSTDSAPTGSPVTGGVDLLSAVVHELGHLLGFDHDVMGSTLGVGVRDLGFLDEIYSDSLSGTQTRQPGDVNRDGRFDQRDLVSARQRGKYLTGQAADWAEGDWNGDGLFDQLDIVAALQAGYYLGASESFDSESFEKEIWE